MCFSPLSIHILALPYFVMQTYVPDLSCLRFLKTTLWRYISNPATIQLRGSPILTEGAITPTIDFSMCSLPPGEAHTLWQSLCSPPKLPALSTFLPLIFLFVAVVCLFSHLLKVYSIIISVVLINGAKGAI